MQWKHVSEQNFLVLDEFRYLLDTFKSFLENNTYSKRLFPGGGNLSDLYFQHVTASRQPLMDSQQ